MMTKNGIQNSFAFTGNERDGEKEGSRGPFASERGDEPRSGIPNGSTYLYTYFGARYMDHEQMTMWLSVDPMADKYPSISPYAYCAWNPMKLVDPDGKEIDDYFSKDGKYLGSDNALTHNVRIISEDNWESLYKDESGRVCHDDAYVLSYSFSEASSHGMSEKAQLSVYQHYNLTGYSIEPLPEEDAHPQGRGMSTLITTEDGDKAMVEHLYVKLGANRMPNINGEALCDNADEIVSCFVHERNHIRRAIKMGYRKWLMLSKTRSGRKNIEESAIKSQKEHSSWEGCREYFKKGVEEYDKEF